MTELPLSIRLRTDCKDSGGNVFREGEILYLTHGGMYVREGFELGDPGFTCRCLLKAQPWLDQFFPQEESVSGMPDDQFQDALGPITADSVARAMRGVRG